jgi:hypothetical protein
LASTHKCADPFDFEPAPTNDPDQDIRTKEETAFRPANTTWGGGTMKRDTLLFRISLIWLAIIAAGGIYLLLTL